MDFRLNCRAGIPGNKLAKLEALSTQTTIKVGGVEYLDVNQHGLTFIDPGRWAKPVQ